MNPKLVTILDQARDLGYDTQVEGTGVVAVNLGAGAWLGFVDNPDMMLIGFKHGDWHIHPGDPIEVGDETWTTIDGSEILAGVATGDWVVVEMWQSGTVIDRRLQHRHRGLSLESLADGEELRIRTAGPPAG